jgi:parallel beta-helix repeat protein
VPVTTTMSDQPAAFLTYVRFDDEHENGRLSDFCKRLGGEIQVQTGEPFHIFQDRNDIAWGQQWRARIEKSLDAVTFLVAVITPGFFKRAECRKELERFLEREEKLGRGDLILPVYYVNTPALNDEAKRKSDPLMQVIASRQYADWRELRFEPWTSPQVGKTIAVMAQQIAVALERQPVQQATASAVPAQQQTPAETRLAPKSEPPTRIVDPLHRGDYTTVSEAVKAAKPGDRILVRPGLYAESVIIDKPIEIIGDGDRTDIVIESRSAPAISFQSTMGRVANLTLRRGSGDLAHYCVDISQGRLDLEDCDISSQSLACVGIHAGADPRLRRNVIHDGNAAGVYIYTKGRGTLEDNDIFANHDSGVEIKSGGSPMIRRNRIRDGKASGFMVHDQATGTIEDNDVFGNALSGVEINDGSPMIRRNRIHNNGKAGVFVHDQGAGTIENNDIFANQLSGMEIKSGGNPIVRRNKIHDGTEAGVFVNLDGLGTLEDNEIENNRSGVEVASGGKPTVQMNRVSRNRWGIVVRNGGSGMFERNDLRENSQGRGSLKRRPSPTSPATTIRSDP